MTDDDLLENLRSELADVRLGTPIQDVLDRGNALRRHRRMLPAAGAGAVATAAGLALGLGAVGGSSAAHASLDAWTVTKLPHKTVSVTIRARAESGRDRLRLSRALVAVGVPALVRTKPPACQLRLSPLTPQPIYTYHRLPQLRPIRRIALSPVSRAQRGTVIQIKVQRIPKGARIVIVVPGPEQRFDRVPTFRFKQRREASAYIIKPSGRCTVRRVRR